MDETNKFTVKYREILERYAQSMKAADIKIAVKLCPVEDSTVFGFAELTFPDGQKAQVELFSIYGAGLTVGHLVDSVALVDQVIGDERRKLHEAIRHAFEEAYPDFDMNEFHEKNKRPKAITGCYAREH